MRWRASKKIRSGEKRERVTGTSPGDDCELRLSPSFVRRFEGLLMCPITLDAMDEPVVADDGNTYERSAIEDHLNRCNESPLTRKRMSTTLTTNRAMQDLVREWATVRPGVLPPSASTAPQESRVQTPAEPQVVISRVVLNPHLTAYSYLV
eukprot:m.1839 g.1839  ORF g.1839 m.1839 type:complete len:151 (+) comp691_c0_seq1:235-687(+)